MITILSNGRYDPDDEIAGIFDGLAALRPERLPRATLATTFVPGLELDVDTETGWDEFESSVTDQIDGIENRIYSSMFDVDDATWERVVEPVLELLRALPDPDRPRLRRNRHPLLVWERT